MPEVLISRRVWRLRKRILSTSLCSLLALVSTSLNVSSVLFRKLAFISLARLNASSHLIKVLLWSVAILSWIWLCLSMRCDVLGFKIDHVQWNFLCEYTTYFACMAPVLCQSEKKNHFQVHELVIFGRIAKQNPVYEMVLSVCVNNLV